MKKTITRTSNLYGVVKRTDIYGDMRMKLEIGSKY